MTELNTEEREYIIKQALSAKTLPDIEVAARALREWIEQHPEDLSAEDALEPLAIRKIGILAFSPQFREPEIENPCLKKANVFQTIQIGSVTEGTEGVPSDKTVVF